MDKIKTASLSLALALFAPLGAMAQVISSDVTLRPPQSEDVVIENTSKGQPIAVQTIKSAAPTLSKKQLDKQAAHDRDVASDLEYKALSQKPNKVLHPFKRADLWMDYHVSTMRKLRTRIIPSSEFAGIMVGAVCSAVRLFI